VVAVQTAVGLGILITVEAGNVVVGHAWPIVLEVRRNRLVVRVVVVHVVGATVRRGAHVAAVHFFPAIARAAPAREAGTVPSATMIVWVRGGGSKDLLLAARDGLIVFGQQVLLKIGQGKLQSFHLVRTELPSLRLFPPTFTLLQGRFRTASQGGHSYVPSSVA